MGLSALDYRDYRFPCGPEDCSESVTCWNDRSERPLLNYPTSETNVSSTFDDPFDGQLECETIDGKGKTVLQRRRYNKPFVNFNRPWRDYETGFGSHDNFWIGLKRMNRLSTKGRNLLNITAGNYTSNHYSGFWVADASSRYTMHAGPKNGKGFDPLETSKGRPFTAPDGGRMGCANKFTSGWWFGRVCRQIDINLNGRLNSTGWDRLFMQYSDVTTCRMTIERTDIHCNKTCPNGGTCRKSDNPESYVCDCQPRYTGRRCEVSLEDTIVATIHTTTIKAIPTTTVKAITTTTVMAIPMTSRTFTSPTTPSPVDGFDLFLYVYLPIFLAIVFLIGMSLLIARKCVISKKKEIHINTDEETPLVQEDQTTRETSHVRKSKRHKKHRSSKKKGQGRTILSALETFNKSG